MPRQDKYYGTYTIVYGDMNDKIRKLGYNGTHNQFRVVCKAKSRAEANRIAESYDLGKNCFHRDYTSETGNKTELELCDKYGFIISIDGTYGREYVDIKQIL